MVSYDMEVVKIEYISYFVHIMYGPGHTPALTTHGFCVTQSGQGLHQDCSNDQWTTAYESRAYDHSRERAADGGE